ncbi:MAG TPA: MFS transporter [Chitinophagaceae bacterium]|jgi:ACS family glucarate transporter-like MFS transporter|nr:MFS transporter [Chitinophagaceae bacterium]
MLKTIRWKIGFLMFLGILINYLDRVNISQSIIEIPKSFPLTEVQKGWVMSAFFTGYVLMMMIGGYVVFKKGARKTLTAATILLAFASTACGLSFGFVSLLVFRFLIGVFEAPVYPAFASVTGRWFPKQERVKAIGLFDIGSYAGIGFATLVIAWVITAFNWRTSFIFSGVLTLVWSIVWYCYFRDDPAMHPRISRQEVYAITAGTQQQVLTKAPLLKFIAHKKVIGISIGFFCFNYLKSFYLTWLPTYLVKEKGLQLLSSGIIAATPIIFAILGEIATAVIIDRLIAKGHNATRVKKTPVCLGMMLSTIIIFSLFTSNIYAIVALLTLSYIFLVSASVSIWSIPEELAQSKSEIAIIGSIQNTFSNISGIVAPVVTGYLYAKSGSFLWPFIVSVMVSIAGSISYWFIAGRLTFIHFNKQPAGTASC